MVLSYNISRAWKARFFEVKFFKFKLHKLFD